VKEYYGKVLSRTEDLKTSACCAAGAPPLPIRNILKNVPDAVMSRFYGCGAPLPLGIEGLSVLDLGSGSGRDCYVACAAVGPRGKVIGIDMTDEQLQVARQFADDYCQKTLGYPETNLRFVKGYIEKLGDSGIEPGSIDIIISNCVINLSPDKPSVFREAWKVLAVGGEMYFSDVYCDRRLPEKVRNHKLLWGECIAGALYVEDFKRIVKEIGFSDVRMVSKSEIVVSDSELSSILGEAKFYSITYRLFKIPELLESACEDYGQVAIYKGTIPGSESAYEFDAEHRFVTGKPALVCGNTAAMIGEGGHSWLSKHFQVIGDRAVHYGLFPCSPAPSSLKDTSVSSGSCCA